MPEVKLGMKARDVVTGFSGIVTAITQWLTGCDTVQLQPQEMKDGTPIEPKSFDVTRIEILDESNILEPKKVERNPGGPHDEVRKPSGVI